ncbi:MAG: DUF4270 family protein [Cytophagaceae bacterium]
MQAKIYGLPLLAALFLFSCKDPAKLGKDLNPTDHPVNVFFTDTMQAKTAAVLIDDSIVTSNTRFLFAGVYEDPKFGKVTSEAYTQYRLKNENTSTAGGTCDSVVLELAYGYYTYDPYTACSGNFKNIPPFGVYKLGSAIPGTHIYGKSPAMALSSADRIDTNNTSTFNINPIYGDLKGVLRIHLKNTFGQDILDFNGAGTTNATLLSNFNYNGIGLRSTDTTNPSALLAFDVARTAPQSRIIIYYKGADLLPNTCELFINTDCHRASKYTFTRGTGTGAITSLSSAPYSTVDLTLSNETVYIQGGSGIRTQISFPGVEEIRKKGNILINKAELFIPVEDIYAEKYNPPKLVLYQDSLGKIMKDTNNADVFVQLDGLSVFNNTSPAIVFYNPAKKGYTFALTSYMQAVMLGKKKAKFILSASPAGVIFYDAAFNAIPSPAWNSFPTYRVVGGSISQPVKLRIYYTVAK